MTISGWVDTKLDLCLDFANTVDWRASDQPEETLHTYSDLVTWAQAAGIVGPAEGRRLQDLAESGPGQADHVLEEACTLREAIYRVFLAVINQKLPAEKDLAVLNQALAAAMQSAHLEPLKGGFAWAWEHPDGSLEAVLRPIARSAGALLTSELLGRVGQCADDRGCGYLFLDTSKNHSRRWCKMGNCGNRAKQRRYYLRTQPAPEE